MSLISASDFAGIYKISQQSSTTTELNDFIEQMEPEYLAELFGAELSVLFLADINAGVPTTERFLNVYNAFILDGQSSGSLSTFYVGSPFNPYFPGGDPREQNTIQQSFGMKDMLTGLTYFEFMKDGAVQAGPSGLSSPDTMTSTKPGSGGRSQKLSEKYNRAIKSYQAIQWYMTAGPNASDYSEFKGVCKQPIYMGGIV